MSSLASPFVPRALAVVAGVALALLLTGCHKPHETPSATPALPAVRVSVQTVSAQKHAAFEEAVGTVRPRLQASLEAKVSGRVAELKVGLGQTVQAGDLLITLDVMEIQAKLDQALALQQQAQRDLERYATLLQQEAVTQAEYDGVEARQRVAAAGVAEARTMLDYAQVRAPFAGIITRTLVDVGDLAGPGRPLLAMEDPSRLRLEADVPEGLFGRVPREGNLTVSIPALGTTIEGAVAELSPVADPGSRTFRVKLNLPPTDGLRSGQFGRLLVPVAERSTPRVPKTAITLRGQMELAFVVTNGVARMRLVKTGREEGQQVEVLAGLEPGETIVVEGAQTLRDGQPVETAGQG